MSFHLRAAMPNGPDVSGIRTVRGEANKDLLLTSCDAEWARCQLDEYGKGWGN